MKKVAVVTLVVVGALLIIAVNDWRVPYIMNLALINVQDSGEAHVFISALYPEGFRQIAEYDVKNNRRIVLDLGELRKAWMDEYKKNKRLSQPLVLLTIVTEDGKVSVEAVGFDWDELPQSKTVTPKFRPLKNASNASTGKTDSTQSQRHRRTLVDSYEWTAPVIVAQVTPDSSTSGYISYTYFPELKVGFSVNAFVDSEWVRLGSYNIIQKGEGGKHAGSFGTGTPYYIWMNVTYRYEKWRVSSGGRVWHEEYVYIKDAYPDTLRGGTSKPPEAQTPPIDRWVDEGVYESTNVIGYYAFNIWGMGADNIAVDALKFIEALEDTGKISRAAAEKANIIGIFIDVRFEYGMKAFDFDLALYSNRQETHHVWMGESTDTTTAPVLCFRVE